MLGRYTTGLKLSVYSNTILVLLNEALIVQLNFVRKSSLRVRVSKF